MIFDILNCYNCFMLLKKDKKMKFVIKDKKCVTEIWLKVDRIAKRQKKV